MIKKMYCWLHRVTSPVGERGEYSGGYWQSKVRREALSLCKEVRSKGWMLEVGCGEGLFLESVWRDMADYKCVGIDIWGDILKKAKDRLKRTSVNLINADAHKLPFKDDSFCLVACINVFFNLPSKDIFYNSLREMLRVCKVGGEIIFDIRNRLNPFLYWKYKLARYYDETVTNLPLRTYDFKEVILYINKYGGRLIDTKYIGFPSNSRFSPIIILKFRKLDV